jgi:hypothetical protein
MGKNFRHIKAQRKLVGPKRKVVTLVQLYDAVLEVAKRYGQYYVTVKIEMDYTRKIKLVGYIHTFNYVSGNTIDEVVNGLIACKEPVEPKAVLADAIVELDDQPF